MNSLHIEGRRWWRKSYGGTYCTARIFINGKLVHITPYEYGPGDYYLTVAMQWLIENGYAPEGTRGTTIAIRDVLKGTYSVVDVPRQKDL